MTDIEIAQACEMRRIGEVAAEAGIAEEYLEPYGRYKAKISLRLSSAKTVKIHSPPQGGR